MEIMTGLKKIFFYNKIRNTLKGIIVEHASDLFLNAKL